MAKSRDAYVDTSALIALADQSDSHHSLFKRLFANPPRLFTTVLVIAEGQAWFLRRYDRHLAFRFLLMIEEMTPLSIVAVGQAEQLAAFSILRKFSDQDLTLTDAVGLQMMRNRKIKSCWSTDFHLGLTGVPLVIHAGE
jgi:predicted nucleic acid-binding protein